MIDLDKLRAFASSYDPGRLFTFTRDEMLAIVEQAEAREKTARIEGLKEASVIACENGALATTTHIDVRIRELGGEP